MLHFPKPTWANAVLIRWAISVYRHRHSPSADQTHTHTVWSKRGFLTRGHSSGVCTNGLMTHYQRSAVLFSCWTHKHTTAALMRGDLSYTPYRRRKTRLLLMRSKVMCHWSRTVLNSQTQRDSDQSRTDENFSLHIQTLMSRYNHFINQNMALWAEFDYLKCNKWLE